MKASSRLLALVVVAAIGFSSVALAAPDAFGEWSPAQNVEAMSGADPSFNSVSLDGCPFVSPDGKQFFMASNRPGGLGGLDIWVATRAHVGDPWGAPMNVGAPVNSAADDFCPTLARDGHTFYFVSARAGGCGGSDIYVTRRHPLGWNTPENLGCQVNSSANEFSPFPLHARGEGAVLYFSSNRPGGFSDEPVGATSGDNDLYVSELRRGGYDPASLVPGVNTSTEDSQPNVRHDGLELFFFSTRPGTLGMADIYSATRERASDPWSDPLNLGPNVNSADGAETRPSLSWDGTTLYFGSTRPGGEGSSDIYVTTRDQLKHSD